MSDWKIETVKGESVLAHSEARGRVIASERADIEAAERAANAAGRTLVFVRLFTDGGMSYYYPLRFIDRLTEGQSIAVGPGCGLAMWTDSAYRQERTPLPVDLEVDYTDGTVPLSRPSIAFITSRGYALPTTPEGMAAQPWFNLWQRRLWPYHEVEQGHALYWYDATEQAIVWESRLSRVEKFSYQTKEEAQQRLRDIFADPNLTHPYLDAAADQGHCVAYSVDQVRSVRVPKPAGLRFPQEGWLRCIDTRAQEWLSAFLDHPDGPSAPDLTRLAAVAVAEGQFSSTTQGNERDRTLRSVVDRRGQPEFRARLIDAYGGRCAVTGCDAVAALEAAHIVPCSEHGSDDVSNGLLLRADIHTLFDLDLIGIEPETLAVRLGEALRGTAYSNLEGRVLTLPVALVERPNREALAARWRRFG